MESGSCNNATAVVDVSSNQNIVQGGNISMNSDVITKEQAQQMWKGFEGSFNEAAIDKIIASFADDAVVRFADLPEMRGIEEIGKFLRARFARLKGYRIKKSFKSVADNIIGGMWDAEWVDAKTGKKMQGRGAEFVSFARGKIIEWDCAFNIWEKGVPHQLEII
jgi:nuclear transport factor 2 (NTF2) superfamily protein